MINELVQELRSYPAHYTAAHKAADALDKAEKNRSHMHYYACRLEDELVKAQREIERLREHIAQQQLDIVTLSGEMGRLRKALAKIAQYDMQFIAIDALCPDERIRENRRSDAHDEIKRLLAEVEEQARLNDIGVERELAAEAEIKRLRARETRLREALREIEWSNNSAWQSDRARAALGEEKK